MIKGKKRVICRRMKNCSTEVINRVGGGRLTPPMPTKHSCFRIFDRMQGTNRDFLTDVDEKQVG